MAMNVEWVEKTAKEFMEKNKGHSTQFMVITPDNQIEMYLVVFTGDEEKETMLKSMRQMIQVRKIPEYFVIMEGWRLELPMDAKQKPYVRPSLHPDRIECLLINHYREDLRNTEIILDFKRENDKIIWTKRIENKYGDKERMQTQSRWNFYVEDYQGEMQ